MSVYMTDFELLRAQSCALSYVSLPAQRLINRLRADSLLPALSLIYCGVFFLSMSSVWLDTPTRF